MTPAPAVEAKDLAGKSAEPKYATQTRLGVLYFHGSVMFGTEMSSAAVGNNGSNTVDSIVPGRLADDGTIVLGSEGAQGLVLRKKRHDLATGKRMLAQTLVPWANIKSIGYVAE